MARRSAPFVGVHCMLSILCFPVTGAFVAERGFILGTHVEASSDKIFLLTTDSLLASDILSNTNDELKLPVSTTFDNKRHLDLASMRYSFQVSSNRFGDKRAQRTVTVMCLNAFGCETLIWSPERKTMTRLNTNLNDLLLPKFLAPSELLLLVIPQETERGFSIFTYVSSFVFDKREMKLTRCSGTLQISCTIDETGFTKANCSEISNAADVLGHFERAVNVQNETTFAEAASPILTFAHGSFVFVVSSLFPMPYIILTRLCANDQTANLTSRMQLVLQLAPSVYAEVPAISAFQTTAAFLHRSTNETLFLALRALSNRTKTLALFLVKYDLARAMSRFDKMAAVCETDNLSSSSPEVMTLVGNEWRRCAELNRNDSARFSKCLKPKSEMKSHMLSSYPKPEGVTTLLTMQTAPEAMFSVVDLVVVDDNTAFMAIQRDQESSAYTLVKISFGYAGASDRRKFPECGLWSASLRSAQLQPPLSGKLLAASGDRLFAVNFSTLVQYRANACELYQSCQAVVHASLAGDPLKCVWCARNAAFGKSISPSETADCRLQVTSLLDDCLVAQVLSCDRQNYAGVTAAVVITTTIALILCGIAVLYRMRKPAKQINIRNIANEIAKQTANHCFEMDGLRIPYARLPERVPPELRIEFARITTDTCLAEGNFGIVFKANLSDLDNATTMQAVAVKTLKPGARISHLIDEGLIMRNFDNQRLLPLLGISFYKWVPHIVTPFMKNGDLRSYLRNPMTIVSQRDLLQFGFQIAEGMEYLHSKSFVHRDLACRNCLLDNDLKVKIGDFTLCRNVDQDGLYHGDDNETLPVKWLAPESFQCSMFSLKSDVWSYGVLLWELMTRCDEPYMEVGADDGMHDTLTSQLVRAISTGYRLRQTEYCPSVLYTLMCTCWDLNAEFRPTFSVLQSSIADVLSVCYDDVEDDGLTIEDENAFQNTRVSLTVERFGDRSTRDDAYHPMVKISRTSSFQFSRGKERRPSPPEHTLYERVAMVHRSPV